MIYASVGNATELGEGNMMGVHVTWTPVLRQRCYLVYLYNSNLNHYGKAFETLVYLLRNNIAKKR